MQILHKFFRRYYMEGLQLTDLLDVQVLQQIQDSFSRFTGIAANTTDENGVPVTRRSGFTRFCGDMTRESSLGSKRCEECARNGAISSLLEGKPAVYTCHAGLTDFAAPIMLEGKLLGSFLGGQVRTAPIDEEKIRQTARELGIDPDEYLAAAKETKLMDKESVKKAAEFLMEIAQIFSNLAYQNYCSLQKSNKLERAARSQSMFLMDVSEDIRENMKDWLDSLDQAMESQDTDAIIKIATEIDSHGKKILSNVEDAMDYIRLADGSVELVEGKYQIRDYVKNAIDYTRSLSGHEHLDITFTTDPTVPQYLLGDAARISQIISKLCQTLQHFTNCTKIHLHVSCYKESYATMLQFQIKILDDIIDDDEIESFQQYITNDKLYLDCMNENALGLTMVRLLVHQMSGFITLEKSPEGTLCSSIRIPQLEVSDSENTFPAGGFGSKPANSNLGAKPITEDDYISLFPSAMEQEEFKVYYQPKVDLKNYHMNGAEALCRWFHNGKMISPGEFIPVFEQTGDICALDFYMLEHVCQDIRRWLDEGRHVVKVSVNLSRCHTINEELLQKILEIVDKYEVPHKYIEVELTETTTDVNFTNLKTISYGLLDHGISTSVDDFGIGYSSLKLIQELPWNVLKIDRTFLPASNDPQPRKYVMLKHLISLSNDMGLKCIVEGVETIDHVKLLKKHNCYRAQGFYFDRPLPVEDFEKRLDSLPAKKIS